MNIDPLRWAEWIFLLAPFATVPLGLAVALRDPRAAGRAPSVGQRSLASLLVIAAPCLLLASNLQVAATVRLALLVPYAVFVAIVVAVAAHRFFTRRPFRAEELAIDVGLASLAVGVFWLVVYHGGYTFRGFTGLWALLTVNHFHFAGFGCLILTGATGRFLARYHPHNPVRTAHRLVTAGLIIALPVLALGIDLDRTLEIVGIVMYAALIPALAVILLFLAARTPQIARLPRVLFAVSALAAATSITLAILWGLFRPPIVDIPAMVVTHGTLNAGAFIGLGMTACYFTDRDIRLDPDT